MPKPKRGPPPQCPWPAGALVAAKSTAIKAAHRTMAVDFISVSPYLPCIRAVAWNRLACLDWLQAKLSRFSLSGSRFGHNNKMKARRAERLARAWTHGFAVSLSVKMIDLRPLSTPALASESAVENQYRMMGGRRSRGALRREEKAGREPRSPTN